MTEYYYSGTESLWCGNWNHLACRRWKCEVDHPSQSTEVNLGKKRKWCSLWCPQQYINICFKHVLYYFTSMSTIFHSYCSYKQIKPIILRWFKQGLRHGNVLVSCLLAYIYNRCAMPSKTIILLHRIFQWDFFIYNRGNMYLGKSWE